MPATLSAVPEVIAQPDVAALRVQLDAACRAGSDEKLALWKAYRRSQLLARARVRSHDADVAMWPELREMCRRSVGFFSRTYADIYEPKRASTGGAVDIPYIPYPHQEWASSLLLELLGSGGTLVINKGRQYGLTWGLLITIAWLWLYRDGMKLGVGSRTEDIHQRGVRAGQEGHPQDVSGPALDRASRADPRLGRIRAGGARPGAVI
jgi:hypothetical protein